MLAGTGFIFEPGGAMPLRFGEDAFKILSKIVNVLDDIVSFIDAEHIYQFVNDRYLELWKRSRDEIVGHSVPELIGEDIYRRVIKPKLDHGLAGAVVRFQAWFTFADENRRYMDVTYYPIRDNGEIIGVVVYGHDVTELRKTNQQLEEALSTAWMRAGEVEALLNCSRIVLEVHDFPTAARRIFDSCRRITGATAGYVALLSEDGEENELLFLESGGQECSVDPELPMPIRGLRAEAYQSGETVLENDFPGSPHAKLLPEGHARLTNVLFAPLNIQGETVGVIGLANKPGGFFEDDTRLATAFAEFAAMSLRNTRATKALEWSQEQLSLALDAASMGTWIWDILDGKARRDINMAKLADESPDVLEADGPMALFGRIHPDDAPVVEEKLNLALQRAIVFEDEYRVLNRQGKERWVRNTGRVVQRKNTEPSRMAGAVADVTERKRIEVRLETQYRFVRSLMDAAPNPIFYKDVNGRLLGCNTAFEQFLGVRENELRGQQTSFIPNDEMAAQRREQDVSLLADGGVAVYETKTPHASGEMRDVMVTKSLFTDHEGRPAGVIGVLTDITERMHAEQEVKESEKTLRNILDALKAAILIIDPSAMRVVDVNDLGVELFGQSREDLVGRSCLELPWLDEYGRRINSCPLLDGNVTNRELRVQRPDGKIIPVSKTVVTSQYHGAPHLFEIMLDLSRQKAMERQLTHAQKMESIGQLAAGIAHEINTPTQYVGDNLYFLQQGFDKMKELLAAADELAESAPDDARQKWEKAKKRAKADYVAKQVPRALEQSLEGTSRVATIVQAMKKFSHPEGEEKKPVDVNAAIQNTVTVARNEWKYHAELNLDLAKDLPLVPCYPGDLNQAVLNIVVNAAHSIDEKVKGTEEKGLITIRTERKGDFVDIMIQDNGMGIPESHQKRIFDPFFTTKEVGKGTGQGLAITYDVIVNKHGGDIYFTTEEGDGTTFVIRLPVNQGDGQ
jgi:PAS domain S-box-containing protein